MECDACAFKTAHTCLHLGKQRESDPTAQHTAAEEEEGGGGVTSIRRAANPDQI